MHRQNFSSFYGPPVFETDPEGYTEIQSEQPQQELPGNRSKILGSARVPPARKPTASPVQSRAFRTNLDFTSAESIPSDFWDARLPAGSSGSHDCFTPSPSVRRWLMYFLALDMVILAFVMVYQAALCAHLVAQVKDELARMRLAWERDGFYTCTASGQLAHALPVPNTIATTLPTQRRL